MYTQFYRLDQKPFALLPDPRFLFLGGPHREALAELLEALERRDGLALLLGPGGSGKTTLCCTLLDRLGGRGVDIAFVPQAPAGPLELLAGVHRSFGLSATGASVELLGAELVEYLRKSRCAGRTEILVIDGAHELPGAVLECVRTLVELEEDGQPLLRLLLVGEAGLADLVEAVGLGSRVQTRQELTPLGREQSEQYVLHRLRVAGRRVIEGPIFKSSALRALHAESRGMPRAINAIADRALELGSEKGRERIDLARVRAAARELRVTEPKPPRPPRNPRVLRAARQTALGALLFTGAAAGGLHIGGPALELARPAWAAVQARLELAALDLLDAPAYRAWASRSAATPQP